MRAENGVSHLFRTPYPYSVRNTRINFNQYSVVSTPTLIESGLALFFFPMSSNSQFLLVKRRALGRALSVMKSFPRRLQQLFFAIRLPTGSSRLRPSQARISNARIIGASINASGTRTAFSTDPSLRKDRLDPKSSPVQVLPLSSVFKR